MFLYSDGGFTWSESHKVVASDGTTGELFGISVSASADHFAVGVRSDDVKGASSGELCADFE